MFNCTRQSHFYVEVRCDSGGWRGAETPQCEVVTCPHPAPTPHGYIEISGFTGEYRPGTRARYHCSPGYQEIYPGFVLIGLQLHSDEIFS